ncbi:hypothetical protein Indivirus_1_225 [Indivirus ILV1]|uniref:Uncharacterized protein n=1 Tax=Indivirus ILV1 TaxID=1977633 RepID=A0A1V0SD15_9VIRU|nr:hypothetical protein Indivirus_1_225 [Indivirus ILV1]
MYFIIFAIIIIVILLILTQNKKETFYWEPKWHGEESPDCYSEKPKNCLKFSNCGLCLNKGLDQCLPGDANGPYFEGNCNGWVHSNYDDRHIFNEKVTSINDSWDRFYSDYEATYPSPISRSSL